MTKLLYGTTNTAKIISMRHMLRNINISLINDESLDLTKVTIEESGSSPLENARIKAMAFYDTFGLPRITSYNVCYTKLLRIENPVFVFGIP